VSVDAIQARHEAQIAEAWLAVIGTSTGRMLVWSVLESCGVFRTTFTGDGLSSAFEEGRRVVGLEILQHRLPPDALATMMNENAERMDEIQRAVEQENDDE
jgi:hypothetical protein